MDQIAVRPQVAANLCGLSRSSIYEALARKELRSIKRGSARLIFLADLEAWLRREENEVDPADGNLQPRTKRANYEE
jgi:excisionase family DNA binding protein